MTGRFNKLKLSFSHRRYYRVATFKNGIRILLFVLSVRVRLKYSFQKLDFWATDETDRSRIAFGVRLEIARNVQFKPGLIRPCLSFPSFNAQVSLLKVRRWRRWLSRRHRRATDQRSSRAGPRPGRRRFSTGEVAEPCTCLQLVATRNV